MQVNCQLAGECTGRLFTLSVPRLAALVLTLPHVGGVVEVGNCSEKHGTQKGRANINEVLAPAIKTRTAGCGIYFLHWVSYGNARRALRLDGTPSSLT